MKGHCTCCFPGLLLSVTGGKILFLLSPTNGCRPLTLTFSEHVSQAHAGVLAPLFPIKDYDFGPYLSQENNAFTPSTSQRYPNISTHSLKIYFLFRIKWLFRDKKKKKVVLLLIIEIILCAPLCIDRSRLVVHRAGFIMILVDRGKKGTAVLSFNLAWSKNYLTIT